VILTRCSDVCNICSTAVCDVVCLSYETLREALAGSREAAYRLCNAVQSMLELYAESTKQISFLPLAAGELLPAEKSSFSCLLYYSLANNVLQLLPQDWNSLPAGLRQTDLSYEQLKRLLKTYL